VFRAALDEKLDLARAAASAIGALPGVEIVAEPALSLFAFRLRCEGMSFEEADARNRRLCAAVNAGQRVLLTGAVVKGRFVVRMCILSFRTHEDRVAMAVEDVAAAVAALGAA
jgi:aromatic-L-amino-acid decarboxylase